MASFQRQNDHYTTQSSGSSIYAIFGSSKNGVLFGQREEGERGGRERVEREGETEREREKERERERREREWGERERERI